MRKRWRFYLVLFVIVLVAAIFRSPIRRMLEPLTQRMAGVCTVSDRLKQFGPVADARWRPFFESCKVAYPPSRVVLLGLKNEKQLEVYAGGANQPLRRVRSYPIRAASGKLGPKLREGDWQVPEGIYPIESLNPNSRFHLALKVGYPNALDRKQGELDGRKRLGGDIMIHGNEVSIGCLAMGDEAAEDLFVLAARTGLKNVKVILSPVDFRTHPLPAKSQPTVEWIRALYRDLEAEVKALP
jgi:murein L,D-transpeptidase YafK